MSTEQTETVQTEAASTPPPQAVAETPAPAPPKELGTEPIDFSKLRPEDRAVIEPRFRRLWKHMKDNERTIEMLTEQNGALVKKWDEQETRLSKIETRDERRETAGEMASLRTAYKTAMESGEYEKAFDINAKIAQKVAAGAAKVEATPKPNGKDHEPPPRTENDRIIERWASETDANGNPLRPWTQDGHPKQAKAAALTNALLVDPDNKDRHLTELLAEVERQMNPASRPAAPVLNPTGSARPPGDKLPGLSAAEREVAEKMFRTMKPKEAHERYAKQKKLLAKE